MTTLDATVPRGAPRLAAPARGSVRFVGDKRALSGGCWFAARVLLMLTLGIYRFWLTTDIRRFLWSNTELAGESFEYTGTARELLLGFLIAIAILVPIYAALLRRRALSVGAIGEMSGAAQPSCCSPCSASSPSIGRGAIGSPARSIAACVSIRPARRWRYAVCALFWWAHDRSDARPRLSVRAVAARALQDAQHLLRRPARPLRGHRAGGCSSRGILMWFLVGRADRRPASLATHRRPSTGTRSRRPAAATTCSSSIARSGLRPKRSALCRLATVHLDGAFDRRSSIPIFQAMVLRWWASGLRFGEVAVTSRLRTAQVYGVYARFLGYACLFTLAWRPGHGRDRRCGPGPASTKEDHSTLSEIIATVGAGGRLCGRRRSAIRPSIRRPCGSALWRCVVESLDISGVAALERVSAAGRAELADRRRTWPTR